MIFSVRGRKYKTVRCRVHFLGMMFRSWKKFDAMIFKFPFSARWTSLWMPFCVKMDVLFVNNNKVVHKEKAVPLTLNPRTWRIYRSRAKYDSIIEIKPDNNIRVGDVIEWK